jgi:hypothetical protein
MLFVPTNHQDASLLFSGWNCRGMITSRSRRFSCHKHSFTTSATDRHSSGFPDHLVEPNYASTLEG